MFFLNKLSIESRIAIPKCVETISLKTNIKIITRKPALFKVVKLVS